MKLAKPDFYIGASKHPRIRLTKIVIDDAPEWMNGMTCALVSDTHLRQGESASERLTVLKNISLDMLFVTGDLSDDKPNALRMLDEVGKLKPKHGAFMARGNNDVEAFADDLRELDSAAAKNSIRLLVNASARVSVCGKTIAVGGVDELTLGTPKYDGLFSTQDDYKILLSHYPVLSEDCQADLMLSGHTHGGQFNFLGFTPYVLRYESPYSFEVIHGKKKLGRTTLVVSKGIGMSKIPLRIGVRPEIILLRFERKKST